MNSKPTFPVLFRKVHSLVFSEKSLTYERPTWFYYFEKSLGMTNQRSIKYVIFPAPGRNIEAGFFLNRRKEKNRREVDNCLIKNQFELKVYRQREYKLTAARLASNFIG